MSRGLMAVVVDDVCIVLFFVVWCAAILSSILRFVSLHS